MPRFFKRKTMEETANPQTEEVQETPVEEVVEPVSNTPELTHETETLQDCGDCQGTGLRDHLLGGQATTLCKTCEGSGKIK